MALIYGIHPVEEALKGKRRIRRLIVSKSRKKNLGEMLALANSRGVQVVFEEDYKVEKLAAGGRHQGVLLDIEDVKEWTLDEALQDAKPLTEQVWIALDEIEDPHNLGAIIRSAACFGAQVVLLPERRSAQITPTVEKAASGALDRVKVVSVGNLNQAMLQLKENGFQIAGGVAPDCKREPKNLYDQGPQAAYAAGFARPLLLVVGSEGKGLREKVAEKCDMLVFIPQAASGVESLNASCASAVLLYEIFRQSQSCRSCA